MVFCLGGGGGQYPMNLNIAHWMVVVAVLFGVLVCCFVWRVTKPHEPQNNTLDGGVHCFVWCTGMLFCLGSGYTT